MAEHKGNQMSEVAKINQQDVGNALTPMEMINKAVSSGAGIEVIEKLMTLQERWDANQSRKSFDAAISGAKSEIKPIFKNRKGHNSNYADLANISEQVDPVLTSFGLSYRFRSNKGDRVSVTCVLSHKDGYSEETTLDAPTDTSGNKNAIQAIGSAITYLQRYTLTLALGLSTTNDDDGAGAVKYGVIEEEQKEELLALIQETNSDTKKLLQIMKVPSIDEIRGSDFEKVRALLLAKKGGSNG